jgi:hypothetical protein
MYHFPLNFFSTDQPTRCRKFSSLLLVVQIQLNMFRASSCPSSGATTTAVAASGLPLSLVIAVLLVVVGPARPQPTALLSPSSDGKPEAATAVVIAPDDGREDAQNMLSCI